jgi:hypothetical protein
MNDEPDKRERKNAGHGLGKDPRQDRLKLALRENLKRRKTQARVRSETTAAPSGHDDPSPHEAGEKAE